MDGALPTTQADRRHLVFRIGSELHAIDAGRVLEVIRTPAVTRVPYGFAALVGIANLRGTPLPVVAVATFLGKQQNGARKVIVYDHGEPVGLLVDDVVRFDTNDAPDRPTVVDIAALLASAMVAPARPRPALARSLGAVDRSRVAAEVDRIRTLLTFRAAGQTFGLRLDSVSEILAWPDGLVTPANGKSFVGMTTYRDRALPIFMLAALLALPDAGSTASRIVVVEYRGGLVGLAIDQIDAIRRLPESAIEPLPPVLVRSAESPAEIEAIGRVEGGRALVSILSAEKLFGNDALEQVVNSSGGEAPMPIEADDMEFERFLIFTLGEESYGLPITAVEEVIRLPDSITRLPNAPAFVSGIINLRGKALPLIDQRLRFEALSGGTTARPRAIVVTIDRLTAGFIVDGVSEVVAIPASALSVAPEFSDDRAAVFDRVAHIEALDRMILLVDPRELLSRAERDVVASLSETPVAVAS